MEQGGSKQVGIGISLRQQALKNEERMPLFGWQHAAEEEEQTGGEIGLERRIRHRCAGSQGGEPELVNAIGEAAVGAHG